MNFPSPVTSLICALTLALSATSTFAQDTPTPPPTEKRTIMPESEGGRAFMEEYGFSEAVIHGDTVYLSGVIAGPAPKGMTREETYDVTFQYIGSILTRAGSSWDDVIDITTYHVDIDGSMPALSSVKNRYIKAPFPAWTAIDIDRLFTPEGEVEIKITARLSPSNESSSIRSQPRIDWGLAEGHIRAGVARKSGVYTRKQASRCAGRWLLHVDAVDDGAFPMSALEAFPADLQLGNAIASVEFFRLDVMAEGLMRDASDRAEGQLRRALRGDAEALRTYFEALGECSVTAEAVSDAKGDDDVEGSAG